MEGIIYKLTSPSGKVYIGQTIQEFNTRLAHHKYTSLTKDFAISRAIKKYSIDSFKKEIVVKVSSDEITLFKQLNKLESFYIELYNSFKKGYNQTTGGGNYKVSEDTIEKLRKASTGRKHSEETKKLIGDLSRNRPPINEEVRKRMSNAQKLYKKEHPMSEENRTLLGKRATGNKYGLGHKMSAENKEKLIQSCIKSVYQYSEDNIFIRKWKSAKEAYTELGIEYKNISACCRGKRRIAGGFFWKFEKDVLNKPTE